MELTGKTIVVTGGTSGIGLEMVLQLKDINQVIVVSRSDEKLAALRERYPELKTVAGNLTRKQDVEKIADTLIREHQSIDVLINNAAVQYRPHFIHDDFCYDSIETEINLNFTSVCQLSYLLLPLLIKDTRSIIANINSGLGIVPKTSSAIYCGTKGALNLFSLSLANQLENSNVKVVQGFLPFVDTNMTAGRGTSKMPVMQAARALLIGIEREVPYNAIGKTKLLLFFKAVPTKTGEQNNEANLIRVYYTITY